MGCIATAITAPMPVPDRPHPPAHPARPAATRRAPCRATLAALAALAGCATVTPGPDAGAAAGPALPQVAVTRQVVLPGSPDEVFRFIAAEAVLPQVLTGYGPLPAVLRTSGHTGPWDRPGSARLIHLADGSTVREQVTHHDAPRFFAYRVWDFGHPVLRALADEARGEWRFAPAPGGTQVTWTYTFTASSPLAALPLSGVARWLWQGYMDVCLDQAARLLGGVPGHEAVTMPP